MNWYCLADCLYLAQGRALSAPTRPWPFKQELVMKLKFEVQKLSRMEVIRD